MEDESIPWDCELRPSKILSMFKPLGITMGLSPREKSPDFIMVLFSFSPHFFKGQRRKVPGLIEHRLASLDRLPILQALLGRPNR